MFNVHDLYVFEFWFHLNSRTGQPVQCSFPRELAREMYKERLHRHIKETRSKAAAVRVEDDDDTKVRQSLSN